MYHGLKAIGKLTGTVRSDQDVDNKADDETVEKDPPLL
jgi:hypothetical protein